MTVRGRWVVDDKGELQEDTPKPPLVDLVAKETEEQRKQREKDERDAHPGNYI